MTTKLTTPPAPPAPRPPRHRSRRRSREVPDRWTRSQRHALPAPPQRVDRRRTRSTTADCPRPPQRGRRRRHRAPHAGSSASWCHFGTIWTSTPACDQSAARARSTSRSPSGTRSYEPPAGRPCHITLREPRHLPLQVTGSLSKWRRAQVRLGERRPSRAAGTKGRPVAGPTRRGRPRQGQRGSCGRTGHFREPRPRSQLRPRP